MDTVEGFEVANEPAGFFDDIWKFVSQGFYQTAYAGKEQYRMRLKDFHDSVSLQITTFFTYRNKICVPGFLAFGVDTASLQRISRF